MSATTRRTSPRLKRSKAAGIALSAGAVGGAGAAADALPPGAYSSLHYDLTHGRRLEIDTLQGYAVRLGEKLGVSTPALSVLYAALAPYRDGPPG